jgi:hypothetical protein
MPGITGPCVSNGEADVRNAGGRSEDTCAADRSPVSHADTRICSRSPSSPTTGSSAHNGQHPCRLGR